MALNEYSIPEPYKSIVSDNFKNIGQISDRSLSKYFDGCFDDIFRMVSLYKTWVCVACLAVGKCVYGWGDKPDKCDVCQNKIYEVATFQARAPYVGDIFDYACQYLLQEEYSIRTSPASEPTKIYDFKVRDDVVVETKGSPKRITNPDGSKSVLDRAGMLRSDTEKKAFANARKWRKCFPNGKFFIITNALPAHLMTRRDDEVTAIYDVTKEDQLERFVSELSMGTGL